LVDASDKNARETGGSAGLGADAFADVGQC